MTQLMLRKTGPSHAAAPSPLPQERWGCGLVGGAAAKKVLPPETASSYNKEER
jgi:hypothetical protein